MSGDEYIRESIVRPEADVVPGYPPVMPPYHDFLTDAEIKHVVRYGASLK
jgi:hypothetical protein